MRRYVGPDNIGYFPAEDYYWMVTPLGRQFEFHPIDEGLYYYAQEARTNHNLLKLQDEARSTVTPQQCRQAQKARRLLHACGHPNVKDLKKLLVTQQIPNCPITSKDLGVAEHVFGPDISTMKGNTGDEKLPDWTPTR